MAWVAPTEMAQQPQESVRLWETVQDSCDVLTRHRGRLHRSFSLTVSEMTGMFVPCGYVICTVLMATILLSSAIEWNACFGENSWYLLMTWNKWEFWLASLGPLICFRAALVCVYGCVLWEPSEHR